MASRSSPVAKLITTIKNLSQLLAEVRDVDEFFALVQGKAHATLFVRERDSFVRFSTTLTAEDGTNAALTRLDQDSPQYHALIRNQDFIGPVVLFGQRYFAMYAPFWTDGQKTVLASLVGIPI